MTITDDDLHDRLAALAEWGAPTSVPPLLPERAVVSIDARRTGAGTGWWAVAAAVLVLVLVTAVLRSPSSAPIASGTWTPMAPAPIPARSLAASVWTGTEVVVVGGQAGDGRFLRDAAAYNPTTNTWRTLPDAPVDVLPGATAVWTGREVVIVTGRYVTLTEFPDGAFSTRFPDPVALDPAIGTWRRLPAPDAWLMAVAAADDGTVVALAQHDVRLYVAAYDESEGWREVAQVVPSDLDTTEVREFEGFAAGGRVVFVSREWLVDQRPPAIGFVVDPTTWTTTAIPAPPIDSNFQVQANPALTAGGSLVLLATITGVDDNRIAHVAAGYDLSSAKWRLMRPLDRFPVEHEFFTGLGTTAVGEHVVVLGGIESRAIIDKRKAGSLRWAYDVAEDLWRRLPEPDIDLERVGHTVVWTGRELVVWGGLHHRTGADNRADTPAADGVVYRVSVSQK